MKSSNTKNGSFVRMGQEFSWESAASESDFHSLMPTMWEQVKPVFPYALSRAVIFVLLDFTSRPMSFLFPCKKEGGTRNMVVLKSHQRDTLPPMMFICLWLWDFSVVGVTLGEKWHWSRWLLSLCQRQLIWVGFYWTLINKSTDIASWAWLFSVLENLEDKQVLVYPVGLLLFFFFLSTA